MKAVQHLVLLPPYTWILYLIFLALHLQLEINLNEFLGGVTFKKMGHLQPSFFVYCGPFEKKKVPLLCTTF